MIDKILINETDSTSIQLIRYIFVGGTAFIFDFATLFILTNYLSTFYLLSASIAFIIGLTVNYTLSVLWVFNRSTINSRKAEFAIFSIIGILGLGLNNTIMFIGVEMADLNYLVAKIGATAIVLIFNFTARKTILFNAKETLNSER